MNESHSRVWHSRAGIQLRFQSWSSCRLLMTSFVRSVCSRGNDMVEVHIRSRSRDCLWSLRNVQVPQRGRLAAVILCHIWSCSRSLFGIDRRSEPPHVHIHFPWWVWISWPYAATGSGWYWNSMQCSPIPHIPEDIGEVDKINSTLQRNVAFLKGLTTDNLEIEIEYVPQPYHYLLSTQIEQSLS